MVGALIEEIKRRSGWQSIRIEPVVNYNFLDKKKIDLEEGYAIITYYHISEMAPSGGPPNTDGVICNVTIQSADNAVVYSRHTVDNYTDGTNSHATSNFHSIHFGFLECKDVSVASRNPLGRIEYLLIKKAE